MNTLRKFFAALILLIFVIGIGAPVSAFAQTGTLGTENPYLYCSYYDANGDAVDGNALSSGEYRVDIILSGMQKAAIMQITAGADISSSGALQSLSVLSTYDEDNSSFKLAAADFVTDNSLAIILVSKNTETCSDISTDGTIIASLSAVIDCNGTIDFNDYFSFNTDPDLTFFEADYGDGDDCYALSQGGDAAYTVYPMTADVTPDFNNDSIIITGSVLIAKDANGNTGEHGAREINFMINGEYVLDENGQPAVTSSEVNHFGEFEIAVPYGTTEITVTGASTVDRTVTLSGTQNINNAVIKVVTCNYKKDAKINALDLATFKAHNNMNDADAVIYNLNNDAKVNTLDLAAFSKINNQNVQYAELNLDN